MTFNFVEKVFSIGNSDVPPPLQFYKRGFVLGGSGQTPSWQDIILSGVGSLTLANAKADGLNYLKLFGGTVQVPETYLDTVTLGGGCEQNGTPTPDTPVDIICNNGAIKVSPNLFNKDLVPYVNEYISRSNGDPTTPSDAVEFRHSDYITIKENTQYYVGIINATANSAGLAFYNDTKTFISGISLTQLGNGNNIITSPADTKYIRFSFRTDEGYNTDWQNTVYFVEGNQPLAEFMPYGAIYTDGTVEQVTDSLGNTANAEMLLSVGDYKDTQEILNGNVTRNIGIKVLDGTETNTWTVQSNRVFATMANIGVTNCIQPSSTINLLSTHFSDTNCRLSSLKTVLLYFDAASMNISTATDWNNWLSDQYANGTPVIVIYPLDTATTETVSGQFLSKSPVTQVAGSISNLGITTTESSHTTPTPTNPLQINCNNGVVKLSPNLVEFNETRINSSTWDSADKTKGFEIYADIYGKSVGDSMFTNANAFGVFVPCKQGESISLDFFDYTPSYSRCLYCEITADRKCNTTPQEYANSNAGIITQKTFTLTQSNSIGFIFEWWINAQQTRNYTASNYMIVKGSTPPTKYIPYGAIYADGTTETVQVTGKNLFNKDDSTNWGSWYPASGAIATAGANRTLVIRCLPNTTYYFKHCTYIGGLRAFYTEVENWEIGSPCSAPSGSSYGEPNTVYSITTSANAKWLFVLFGRRDADITATFEEQASDYILSTEELTSDTPYEPYFNGGSATAEMLLKVGDYKDTQEVLAGGVTRNIGIIVLNGSENWTYASLSDDMARIYKVSQMPSENDVALCTHGDISLISRRAAATYPNTWQYGIVSNAGYLGFKCYRSDFANATDFTKWLSDQYNAGTPVIVVYPLAEPTTESVTGQPLTTQAGTNIVEITQASMDNLELEVSYKATV